MDIADSHDFFALHIKFLQKSQVELSIYMENQGIKDLVASYLKDKKPLWKKLPKLLVKALPHFPLALVALLLGF